MIASNSSVENSSVVQVQNKLSSIEKMQNKLRALQATYSNGENIVKRDRQECRRFDVGTDILFENITEAKQKYRDAFKEATAKRRELYKKRVALGKLGAQLRTAELQLSLAQTNEKQKEEKKALTKKMKKGVFTDPLLQKVNLLPEELVKMIYTFLPDEVIYAVKVNILESLLKTSKLLSRCSAALKKTFLTSFCRTRQFLALLPYEEAVKEVSWTESHYYYSSTVKETEVKTLHLLEMAKVSNPKFAHQILKTLHILIDPAKKYKCKKFAWNENPFRNLTIQDVEEIHQT
jgi:hypothetical protein